MAAHFGINLNRVDCFEGTLRHELSQEREDPVEGNGPPLATRGDVLVAFINLERDSGL